MLHKCWYWHWYCHAVSVRKPFTLVHRVKTCMQRAFDVNVFIKFLDVLFTTISPRFYVFDGFCRAMRCISAAYAVMRCVCVCVSVTFVSCVKTNKDIFEIFSPSGSHTILVFFHTKRHINIRTGTPLTGASNAGGLCKNAILDEYMASLHTGLQCCQPYE